MQEWTQSVNSHNVSGFTKPVRTQSPSDWKGKEREAPNPKELYAVYLKLRQNDPGIKV